MARPRQHRYHPAERARAPCEERDDWFDHDSADVAPSLEEVELAEAIEIDET
jgi:hypothetical protein